MIKPSFTAILSAGILGFGLISCTKETDIKYQQDNFKPKDIMVEKVDTSLTALRKLSNMDFSLQLIINDETTAPENEVKNLVLSTTCRSQSSLSSSTHISNWPNPTKINILDILPTDTLLGRSSEEIYCDISYTSTNSYNSTNTGKVSQIKIQNLDSFSNLPSNHVLSKETVNWTTQRNTTVNPIVGSTGTLVCDDIATTQTALSADITLSQLLNESSIRAQSLKSSVQKCRALFRNNKETFLSRVFLLDLPITNPTIELVFSKHKDNVTIVDSAQTVEYRINNPNKFPLKIKMDLRSRVLKFRALFQYSTQVRTSATQELPLEFFWNGQKISDLNPEIEYIAPENSVSTLTGKPVGLVNCESSEYGISHLNTVPTGMESLIPPNFKVRNYIIGFNMGVDLPIAFYVKTLSPEPSALFANYRGLQQNEPSAMPHWDLSNKIKGGGTIEDTSTVINKIVEGNNPLLSVCK